MADTVSLFLNEEERKKAKEPIVQKPEWLTSITRGKHTTLAIDLATFVKDIQTLEIEEPLSMRFTDVTTQILQHIPRNICTRRKWIQFVTPTVACCNTNDDGREGYRCSAAIPVTFRDSDPPDIVRKIKVSVIFPHISSVHDRSPATKPNVRVFLHLNESVGVSCYTMNGKLRMQTKGDLQFTELPPDPQEPRAFQLENTTALLWLDPGSVYINVIIKNLQEADLLYNRIAVRIECETIRLMENHRRLLLEKRVLWKLNDKTYLFHRGQCSIFNDARAEDPVEEDILGDALQKPEDPDEDDVTHAVVRYSSQIPPSTMQALMKVPTPPLPVRRLRVRSVMHSLPPLECESPETPDSGDEEFV